MIVPLACKNNALVRKTRGAVSATFGTLELGGSVNLVASMIWGLGGGLQPTSVKGPALGCKVDPCLVGLSHLCAHPRGRCCYYSGCTQTTPDNRGGGGVSMSFQCLYRCSHKR